jgi:hypothetical protein
MGPSGAVGLGTTRSVLRGSTVAAFVAISLTLVPLPSMLAQAEAQTIRESWTDRCGTSYHCLSGGSKYTETRLRYRTSTGGTRKVIQVATWGRLSDNPSFRSWRPYRVSWRGRNATTSQHYTWNEGPYTNRSLFRQADYKPPEFGSGSIYAQNQDLIVNVRNRFYGNTTGTGTPAFEPANRWRIFVHGFEHYGSCDYAHCQ